MPAVGEDGVGSTSCCNILSKMSRFEKKNHETCKETDKCDLDSGEKAVNRNSLRGPDVGFSRQRLQRRYVSMFKGLKETIFKELKESKMTMRQQLENLNTERKITK